ncbi:hypothetical protein DPMN_113269 [Dreissena polymorpha]|uniref:Uncharacterized protein n=1 Tax=Dreissena polymorpha TaxID=45954 RepID=A0A9D4KIH1_DREPO|nr:hypothetical protein DPMN_113269 [Dreissena polymorpha]
MLEVMGLLTDRNMRISLFEKEDGVSSISTDSKRVVIAFPSESSMSKTLASRTYPRGRSQPISPCKTANLL